MMNLIKLLYPGMHIKRWLLLLLAGLVATSLGFAYIFVHLYRTQPFPEIVAVLTLQFIDRPIRGALFLAVGGAAVVTALLRLNQSLLDAFVPAGRSNIVDTIYNYRSRQRGPRIVAIGGGTGLSRLLRGLKDYTSNITAVVTVADDGGSSGRLRRELGVLPPGDIRNCIVALADVEPLMERLFQYRFSKGSGLDGHSFGNLFIVAMQAVTGSFEQAIQESSRVLAVRGQVLPSTLENVVLCAELADREQVEGESRISESRVPIKRVFLKPENPSPHPQVIRAILEADMVVVGPGSLYTSVLPNLLVPGIARALMASRALKVYVCNVATQQGETDGFSVSDHLAALERHIDGSPFHFVVANSCLTLAESEATANLVRPDPALIDGAKGPQVVLADVIDLDTPVRHDPQKLARVLMRLYYEKATPVPAASGQVRGRPADVV
jgi:uncharacterized cofD-like protein